MTFYPLLYNVFCLDSDYVAARALRTLRSSGPCKLVGVLIDETSQCHPSKFLQLDLKRGSNRCTQVVGVGGGDFVWEVYKPRVSR